MPDPYPDFQIKGSKQLFIFRIPKFNNTVLIDPTANMDGVAGDPISGGDGDGGTTDQPEGSTTGQPEGSTTGQPESSASMLSFSILALVVLLHVAAMFNTM